MIKVIKKRELQIYFVNEIAEFLNRKGCKVIGWDEILKGSPDENIIVQSWSPNGGKRVLQSIKEGRKCIISNFYKYYLDHSFDISPFKKTYEFNPQLEGLTVEEAKNIIGVEAPLWTEAVDSTERIYWQMFPRMTAVSESAWTSYDIKDYNSFLCRLSFIEKRYLALGIGCATKDCYSYAGRSKVLKLLFGRDHPAVSEYKKHRK